MDVVCCIAMVSIFIKIYLITFLGILSLSSRIFIKGICVVTLVFSLIIMKRSIFHFLFIRFFINNLSLHFC